MSDYTTNFPPQTYSSSFYLNSLVDDEKDSLVTKREISSGSEARNGPILDCFISTMKYLIYPIRLLLCLSIFLHFSTAASSVQRDCVLNYNIKPVTFSSLEQYQGSHFSFDPKHPTYQGNIVDFSFVSIDRLLKNSFLGFDSDSIIKLTLNHKKVKIVDVGAFNGLFCLHKLELTQNNISNLPEGVFEGLASLRDLDLSENLFENISGLYFHQLRNLRNLNLSKNKIKSVSSSAFYNLTRLEVMDLSFNNIRNLPPTVFSSLQSLRELHLNKNCLGDIEPEKWVGLNNLEVLNLAENYLNEFDPSYNVSFAGLKKLNLSGNDLSSLNVFRLKKSLVKLEAIDITGNKWFCEDLEVVYHHLADARVAQMGHAKCNFSGEYKQPTTEKYIPSTTAFVVSTEVTNKSTDYTEDKFVKYEKMLSVNQAILKSIKNTQTTVSLLLLVLIMFVLIHIIMKYDIFQCSCTRIIGYFRPNREDAEDMLLRSSNY